MVPDVVFSTTYFTESYLLELTGGRCVLKKKNTHVSHAKICVGICIYNLKRHIIDNEATNLVKHKLP